MAEKPPLSYDELLARTDAPARSTWGLYGPDDEVGMLNVLGPDDVVAAAGLIRRGAVFNLDLSLDAFDPHFAARRRAPTHTMFESMSHHLDDYLDGFYLQGTSQIDSLRHIVHPDHGFYNGHDAAAIKPGSPTLGINRWAERGIVGRGVLLDVDRYLTSVGDPLDQRSGRSFGVEVLEATAAAQGVELGLGDLLLLRTGWLRWALHDVPVEQRAEMGGWDRPGIEQSDELVRWLWEHQVPLLAADNVAIEAIPVAPDTPFLAGGEAPGRTHGMFHKVAIPLLGMALGELWDMEALAEDCGADGVWEFLLVAKPLYVNGGVGTPANALAIK
ncbi:MAG: hypothetical protein JWO68_1358 [Actinomycetia bacterium]|nr:hypothetical protein [Actinomycetes bacterium]